MNAKQTTRCIGSALTGSTTVLVNVYYCFLFSFFILPIVILNFFLHQLLLLFHLVIFFSMFLFNFSSTSRYCDIFYLELFHL